MSIGGSMKAYDCRKRGKRMIPGHAHFHKCTEGGVEDPMDIAHMRETVNRRMSTYGQKYTLLRDAPPPAQQPRKCIMCETEISKDRRPGLCDNCDPNFI